MHDPVRSKVEMYYRQKGFLPIITRISGLLSILYFVVAATFGFSTLVEEEIQIWISLVVSMVVFLIPSIFGLWLISLFPDFRIVDGGVKYKYLEIFKGFITWDEIEEINEINSNWIFRGSIALVISRKGYSFFRRKGLFLQSTHGMLVNSEYPILLLSRGLKTRQEIIDQITKNTGKTQKTAT